MEGISMQIIDKNASTGITITTSSIPDTDEVLVRITCEDEYIYGFKGLSKCVWLTDECLAIIEATKGYYYDSTKKSNTANRSITFIIKNDKEIIKKHFSIPENTRAIITKQLKEKKKVVIPVSNRNYQIMSLEDGNMLGLPFGILRDNSYNVYYKVIVDNIELTFYATMDSFGNIVDNIIYSPYLNSTYTIIEDIEETINMNLEDIRCKLSAIKESINTEGFTLNKKK